MPPKKPNQSTSSPSPRPCGTPSQPQKKTRNMKHEPPKAERPAPLRNHLADEYSLATTNEIAAAGVSVSIYQPPSTRLSVVVGLSGLFANEHPHPHPHHPKLPKRRANTTLQHARVSEWHTRRNSILGQEHELFSSWWLPSDSPVHV